MLRLALLLSLAVLARCDLPIDCRYSDAVGTWLYSETERTGDASLDCSQLGDIVYEKQFALEYPDLVTDELGNQGTWTMIYNQGFEVRINERSYWAPFDYNLTTRAYSCDRLFNGWSRDSTVRNWACFTGVKAGVQNFEMKPYVAPELENPDQKFVNDEDFIERLNAAQSSWTAKAYPEFEQYTLREMIQRAGGVSRPFLQSQTATQEEKSRASLLPESFDWTDVDGVSYVAPVRDQASCGSCYAFASSAVAESQLRIQTQNERQDIFSPQDIVSCTTLAEGCSGGFFYLVAGRYAQDQGLVAEECYPYLGVDAVCATDQTCARTYTAEYEYVGGYYGASNEENMMEALVTRGPLGVDYMVYSDFYQYTGGVYSHVETVKSDFDPFYEVSHAVLLVGYGVDEVSGEKFWKVKNSWGESFGESGFFRIRRGTNECAIESAAFIATVIP